MRRPWRFVVENMVALVDDWRDTVPVFLHVVFIATRQNQHGARTSGTRISADEWSKRTVAAVLAAGARRRNRVATYDETSHRTGPRKQKIPHIADARHATGRLTEEIKIGPRMIGMIENSATLARTAETTAGQRRPRYDDG